MEILPFLILPFLASLILTGIHSYLGVHVVERGVIFVDLALAQIAALGATVAIIVGMDPHGHGSYWISLGFTFLGAAIFAFARTRRGHIPQEAFIGIAYAVASAMAILLMSKATGETEHLTHMLVGNILAVSRPEVIKTALLYSGIGLFHFIFRKKFLLISMNHDKAEQTGLNVRFWISLLRLFRICGYLVGGHRRRPARFLLSDRPQRWRHALCRSHRPALAIGWTMGTLVSALGVYLSVKLDTPTGATIVVTFGGVLIMMFLLHLVLHHGRSTRELKGGVSARRELEAASPSSREA